MENSIQRDSTNRVTSLESSMLSEKRLPPLPFSPLTYHTASSSKASLAYSTTQGVLSDISSRADELSHSPRSRQPSSDRSLPNFASFPAQPTRRAANSATRPSVPGYPHGIPRSELGRGISDTPSINGPRGSNPRGSRRMRLLTQVAGDAKDTRHEAGRGTVFQHRDAGYDRELPPPYMDSHSRRSR